MSSSMSFCPNNAQSLGCLPIKDVKKRKLHLIVTTKWSRMPKRLLLTNPFFQLNLF